MRPSGRSILTPAAATIAVGARHGAPLSFGVAGAMMIRFIARRLNVHDEGRCSDELPLLLVAALAVMATACGGSSDTAAPLATPSVSVNHTRVPLGSPIEVTYRFQVAPSARFDKDYRVLVHFLDADDELMWTDDHMPPQPTSAWKPGQTVEYTRTVFVPLYPYIGEAAIAIGLYAPGTRRPGAARRRDHRPARLPGRPHPAPAADRQRLPRVPRRLAWPGNGRRQPVGRVAVDPEGGRAALPQPEAQRRVLPPLRRPAVDVRHAPDRHRVARRRGHRHVPGVVARRGDPEDRDQVRAVRARRRRDGQDRGRQDLRPGAGQAGQRGFAGAWASACFTRLSNPSRPRSGSILRPRPAAAPRRLSKVL